MTTSGLPTSATLPEATPVPRQPRGSHSLDGPPSTVGESLQYVAVCLVAGVVFAIPAAWLWARLADPPAARLTTQGLAFGELAFNQVSAITFWFITVGFGLGVVLGVVAALFGKRHGLVTPLGILLMCVVGTFLTLWSGIHWFGPNHPVDFVGLYVATPKERTQLLSGFKDGDLLVSSLRLTTPVALLGWPIGGMLGALGGSYVWSKPPKTPWMPPR